MTDVQPIDEFALAVRDLAATILEANDTSIPERLARLASVLPALAALSWALPAAPHATAPNPAPGESDWPGLGSAERTPCPSGAAISEQVLLVHRELWAGFEAFTQDDMPAALQVWSGRMEAWLPAALDAGAAASAAALLHRKPPRAQRTRPSIVALSDRTQVQAVSEAAPEPASFTRTVTRAPREPLPQPGALGIRYEPLGLGVLVVALHPASPAVDHLTPGDVLMSVDGIQLSSMDPAVIAGLLVGAVGQLRDYEVFRERVTRTERFASVPPSVFQ